VLETVIPRITALASDKVAAPRCFTTRSADRIAVGRQITSFACNRVAARWEFAPDTGECITPRRQFTANPGEKVTIKFKVTTAARDRVTSWSEQIGVNQAKLHSHEKCLRHIQQPGIHLVIFHQRRYTGGQVYALYLGLLAVSERDGNGSIAQCAVAL
jgi:hypothetical protein